jgi:hypothetical protein
LRVQDVQTMFVQYNQVIELMLSLAAERSEFESVLNARQLEVAELRGAQHQPKGLDSYVSCFVAMPFHDGRARDIYQALRAVAEDSPHFWRVVRADDTVEKPGLWPNLKTKLLRAHCYIAILTGEVNPNVMIEIGRMEAIQRPLLLFRDGAAADLPSDLHGLLYEELHATGTDLVSEVRDALARQEGMRGLQGARYLSEAALKRYASLDGEASKKISRTYPTWDEFLRADPALVARQIGMHHTIVQAVQTSLAEADDKP